MLNLESKVNVFDSLVDFIRQVTNPGKNEVNKVGDAVRQGYQENFSSEGGNLGTRWLPLAPRTQKERERLGYASQHPILVRSGSYRDSFVERNGPNHIEDYTSEGNGWQLVTGSRDPRGSILNNGGWTIIKNQRVYVPPRPVDYLTESSQQRVTDTIGYLVEEIRKRTLGG